jgi:MraZ protein
VVENGEPRDHEKEFKVKLMFMGEYSHSIDEKGRLIIPSRFRDELGARFVLTRGLDGCLAVYPMTEWEKLEEKLSSLPLTNKSARTITRFLVSAAAQCELDKQGRILVPGALREYAGLEKDVVLTGNLERIEIWDKTKWAESTGFDDMDTIENNLQDCGVMI